MYTQCPNCQTIFVVTPAQIKLRAGLVRCGKCAAVFHADRYLFDTLPVEIKSPEPAEGFVEKSPKNAGNRFADDVAPSEREDSQIPVITEFTPPRRRRVHAVWWALGNVLLVLLLAGQLTFYFRDYLASNALLKPWLVRACQLAKCEIRPLQDPRQIELVEVEVAPHPKFNRALSFSAVLVNRAVFSQPFPLLELSLTDTHGTQVVRRTFKPEEYLSQPALVAQGMSPNVAVSARLEFTQPEPAAGYEVQLVSSS